MLREQINLNSIQVLELKGTKDKETGTKEVPSVYLVNSVT